MYQGLYKKTCIKPVNKELYENDKKTQYGFLPVQCLWKNINNGNNCYLCFLIKINILHTLNGKITKISNQWL